jgi:hypothetical protein
MKDSISTVVSREENFQVARSRELPLPEQSSDSPTSLSLMRQPVLLMKSLKEECKSL